MGSAARDHATAADLPEGDVIRILLEQHARIRTLFDAVAGATGARRQEAFDELRELLAVHEAAEEMVLRPVSAAAAGQAVVDARNHEEAEATAVLSRLEELDVASAEFDTLLQELRDAVLDHAEHEEAEEFPRVVATCNQTMRKVMGLQLRTAEKVAPSHPHPSLAGSTIAQYAGGPVLSVVDHVRDALRRIAR